MFRKDMHVCKRYTKNRKNYKKRWFSTNELEFIKYNRTLRCRYNTRNVIDPILLDNIDDANEWLTWVPEFHEDKAIFLLILLSLGVLLRRQMEFRRTIVV